MSFKQTLTGIIAALAVACTPKQPNPQDFEYTRNDGFTYAGRLIDIDNDGTVDGISKAGRVDPTYINFFAPDLKTKITERFRLYPAVALPMTPEMRAAASAALQADQNLAYLLNKAQYDKQNKEGE